MTQVVITLGEISEETRQAIDRLLFPLGVYNYEVANYDLRADDAKNERRTYRLRAVPPKISKGRFRHLLMTELRRSHTPIPQGYISWRLTELLKTRLRYEPPCNLDSVVAVVYDAAQVADEFTPYWNEVAWAFRRASVYQVVRQDDGKLSLELKAAAD